MWNTIAAAFQLANIQVFGRKRRLVTIIILLLPLILSLIVRKVMTQDINQAYATVVGGMLAVFIVPLISVFWGSALLTDEVEGKTLVFLWTRPSGRARLFVFKYIGMLFWIVLLCGIAISTTYVVMYSRGGLLSNWMVMVWDTRALAFGGACYAALGFFLATIFKKPVIIGIMYAYFFDGVAMYLPGFLKRFSIGRNVLSLATHPEVEKPKGIMELLTTSDITEWQAILTLVCASAALVIAGALILRNKEYLGDDPARSQ